MAEDRPPDPADQPEDDKTPPQDNPPPSRTAWAVREGQARAPTTHPAAAKNPATRSRRSSPR